MQMLSRSNVSRILSISGKYRKKIHLNIGDGKNRHLLSINRFIVMTHRNSPKIEFILAFFFYVECVILKLILFEIDSK